MLFSLSFHGWLHGNVAVVVIRAIVVLILVFLVAIVRSLCIYTRMSASRVETRQSETEAEERDKYI